MSDETQSTSEVASVLPEVEGPSTGAQRAHDFDSLQQPSFVDEHPEALLGAAFVGGLVFAQLFKRRGD